MRLLTIAALCAGFVACGQQESAPPAPPAAAPMQAPRAAPPPPPPMEEAAPPTGEAETGTPGAEAMPDAAGEEME